MMKAKITGIDISWDRICAVQMAAGLKGYQVLSCARVAVEEGRLQEALGSLTTAFDLKSDIYSVTIPEDRVSFRNLRIPFKDVKKIRQALPFEMETMLPFQAEEMVVDFVVTGGQDQDEILAASCHREFIGEYLELLKINGIDPDLLEIKGTAMASWLLRQPDTPDHLILLEVGEKNSTMVLCLNRRTVLIRAFQGGGASPAESISLLGAAVGNTVHAFLSRREGLPHPERLFITGPGSLYPGTEEALSRSLEVVVEKIDLSGDQRVRLSPGAARDWSPAFMNGALSLALRVARKEKGFNLRQGEFQRTKGYLRLRKASPRVAVFLALILVFLTADLLVDYYTLKKEYNSLSRQVTSLFRRTLPGVTRIVDPVQQLRVEIRKLRKSSLRSEAGGGKQVLDLLREISARIPESLRVHIDRMVIDPETVRFSGRTDAFNQVDKVKNRLESSGYFRRVVISSANLDRAGKGVRFEIRIDRKGVEGS